MLASALDQIIAALDVALKLASTPAGWIAAGVAVGGYITKAFKSIGDNTNEKTNKAISRWLKVRSVETSIVAEEANTWPASFTAILDQKFGTHFLSWKSFRYCSIASLLLYSVLSILLFHQFPQVKFRFNKFIVISIVILVLSDFASFLQTRYFLRWLRNGSSVTRIAATLVADFLATIMLSVGAMIVSQAIQDAVLILAWTGLSHRDLIWWKLLPEALLNVTNAKLSNLPEFMLPRLESLPLMDDQLLPSRTIPTYGSALFTSIWLYTYALAGFTVRAIQRLDTGFYWLHSHFDLDKKPLQVIGMVAGPLVAAACWTCGALVYFLN